MEAPHMNATSNNVKALRLELLLTPRQLADRLGVTTTRLRALEQPEAQLPEGWPEAFAHAFGVPAQAVTDPDTDVKEAARAASAARAQDAPEGKRTAGEPRLCRIAARYAIVSMVAKIGGLNVAASLSETDLELALQSLLLYAEGYPRSAASGGTVDKDEISRLSQSLQITVLAILQSHGVEPAQNLLHEMEIARDGALLLIEAYSRVDHSGFEPETK